MTASSAVPRPYQPGRFARACDHAKTHGIARSDAMSGARGPAGPPPDPLAGRDDGRDPRPRPGMRSIGVAAPKNAAKPGSSRRERYAAREIAVSSDIVVLPAAAAAATSRSCSGVEARSVAAVTCSR